MRNIDFSLGNWIALHGGPEEIDRWNRLVEDVQRLQSELAVRRELEHQSDLMRAEAFKMALPDGLPHISR